MAIEFGAGINIGGGIIVAPESAASAPGVPTIGTATATGETTATVAFTQPASNGGSTILSYTATSSPGGITGTLTQAGSGTITVTGLTASTSYTFTVTATNAIGTSSPSASSNSITTDAPITNTTKAIFGYGQLYGGAFVSMTNLVTNTGVVGNDVTGVGTISAGRAAAGYGTDKAIFGYGNTSVPSAGYYVNVTNLVTNTGVVGNDETGVGTFRKSLAAAGYGGDKAIFGFGYSGYPSGYGWTAVTNLVSNTGVVATDTTGVGTAREGIAAAGYGTDKAIFGYGQNDGGSTSLSMTNLVTNAGIVGNDVTGVGTARYTVAAAGYGTDKAIFGYGVYVVGGVTIVPLSMTNLVSNTGVVATDTTGVGTARQGLAAAGYGTDKAIFGYGYTTGVESITNLVSNTGVVATNTTGVGTARANLAAAGYSLS